MPREIERIDGRDARSERSRDGSPEGSAITHGRGELSGEPHALTEPRALTEPHALAESLSRAGLRVLIVEDDALIAMDLEMSLEDEGHEIVGMAATADRAVSLAERHRPDVVMMDLRLADGSFGGDAARVILERLGVRSIFLSGSLDQRTRAELAPLEPLAMISKPFLPEELRSAMESAAQALN